jgi:hypothetical protein
VGSIFPLAKKIGVAAGEEKGSGEEEMDFSYDNQLDKYLCFLAIRHRFCHLGAFPTFSL